MRQNKHPDGFCCPDAEAETDAARVGRAMTEGVAAVLEQLELSLKKASGDTDKRPLIHAREAIAYLASFSLEIGGLTAQAEASAKETGLLAERVRGRIEAQPARMPLILSLVGHIQDLAGASRRSAGSVRAVVAGIRQKVQRVTSLLVCLDQAGTVRPEQILEISLELKQVTSGMLYVVKDYQSIGVNAKEVLQKAEACLRALHLRTASEKASG